MYGRPVETTGVPVPVMIMGGGPAKPTPTVAPGFRELSSEVESRSWVMLSRTDSAWYKVAIEGAGHGHFSDLPLFGHHQPQAIHPRLAHAIINAFSLEFFRRHLLGDDDTPLLSRAASYRDVVLTTKPTPAPQRD